MISSKRDSCRLLVAGNYDVIVDEDDDEDDVRLDITPNNKNNNNNDTSNNNSNQSDLNKQDNDSQTEKANNNAINILKSTLSKYLQLYEQYELELSNEPAECSYEREFKLLREFSKTLKEDKTNLIDGELECNLRKNRYKDIIPFNHTRVILSKNPMIPGSEYINANYIKGQSGNLQAYIACQGPLLCTLDDFWRMIWECNVSIIVMACNEHESGKPKCELYWPDQIGTSEVYGNIRVHLVRVRQICTDFLIRKFSIDLLEEQQQQQQDLSTIYSSCSSSSLSSYINEQQVQNTNNGSINNENNNLPLESNNNYYSDIDKLTPQQQDVNTKNNTSEQQNQYQQQQQQQQPQQQPQQQRRVVAKRTICQFHYTTWPDHGAPDSVQPILELVRLLREVQPAENKPILIHCSAGCGRTGTICCIDYVWGLLKSNKLDENFNLCSIISDMRRQRMAMVQTLEQYILCYRAVAALFMEYLREMFPTDMDQNLIQHNNLGDVNHSHQQYDERDTAISGMNQNSTDEHEFGPVII